MALTYADDDRYTVAGAHGTIAPNQDEAYYDDRSDASDDLEKGRLKFPQSLYGREKELARLLDAYGEIVDDARGAAASEAAGDVSNSIDSSDASRGTDDNDVRDGVPYSGSRVVWLAGYSGIGKTALVNEFIKQAGNKYAVDQSLSIVHASGKYSEQCTSSSPFSAVAEVLFQLATILSEESEQNKAVWDSIGRSELIGPGKEGENILRSTFPGLERLLDASKSFSGKDVTEIDNNAYGTHSSMNAIKECAYELLRSISAALVYPLGIFIDDLQWGDAASFDIIRSLLSRERLRNVMFVCSFRSNEVDAGHPFARVVEAVADARGGSGSAQRMDLFSLSPDAIANFVADSVKKEMSDEVAGLAEVVYTKTTGNIFFVMQALEELVRKNIIFYDMMYFEWRWVASKLDLAKDVSDDVVESVKGKIRELPEALRHLLAVMAHIPNPLDVKLLMALMNAEDRSFHEAGIEGLLKQASEEGMIIRSAGRNVYIFAHDRIRQASLEFGKEKDGDPHELVLHIAHALCAFSPSLETEWCLFVAVDLLNTLPPDKTVDLGDLARLNMRVSKLATGRGSSEKGNELLNRGLKCLEASGMLWKDYALTLEMYNAIILSEHSLGSYDKARAAIEEVLANARSLDDKLLAHLYQLLAQMEETSDYKQGTLDGVKILNLYGFNIPQTFSKVYMMKEEAKHKLALKNGSYTQLTKLRMDLDGKMFLLFFHTSKYAVFSGQSDLLRVLPCKAIRLARKKGIDGNFPLYMSSFASSLALSGKFKASQEVGNVALSLAEEIRHHNLENYSTVQMIVWSCVATLLRPLRDAVGPLLQAYKDLKLIGTYTEGTLNSMMGYFIAYLASGLELGPLLEAKLQLVANYARSLDRTNFLATYQIFLQFALNLRTTVDSPTEFRGEVFNEKAELSEMNDSARKMTLRDSSTYRLQLSFIFGDMSSMASLLDILKEYPLSDPSLGRLHTRLSFTGLAAFALGQNGNGTFLELGEKCLSYFENLTKHGSVNAKPVYLFMLALKRPSPQTFNSAIDASNEASAIHLEAMARERYAFFLLKEKDTERGNNCLATAYWLYLDWGADYKALCMSKEYEFLKNTANQRPKSLTGSIQSSGAGITNSARSRDSLASDNKYTFSYNSTLRSKNIIKRKTRDSCRSSKPNKFNMS